MELLTTSNQLFPNFFLELFISGDGFCKPTLPINDLADGWKDSLQNGLALQNQCLTMPITGQNNTNGFPHDIPYFDGTHKILN